MPNHTTDEITSTDEISDLLCQNQQLLKKYQRLAAELSEKFITTCGDEATAKKIIINAAKFKQSNPKDYEAINQIFDKKMSAFVANRRLMEQKPLNRKGVSGRTWV